MVDTHTHILDERLRERADEIVGSLKKDGIDFIVEIGADVTESYDVVKFANRHERVFCTIGVHPHYCGEYDDEFETWARAQFSNRKIVAMGECGLDYYRDLRPRPLQKEVFIRQIRLSSELGLPLVVHSRDSFEDTYQILKDHRDILNNGILIHCFSYGVEAIKRFGELDCYFAIGGAVTYKNTQELMEALKVIPYDRLLLETDCPYLAPVPLRGTINEPKNVKIIAEFVAGILSKSVELVAEQTTENAKRFFRI